MAQRIDSAKRVINGTYTEVWVDGILKAECTACQAKIAKNKTVIQLCGQFMEDKKATGGSGSGGVPAWCGRVPPLFLSVYPRAPSSRSAAWAS